MMKIITSHWFSLLWTALVMFVSILISIYSQDAMYVARAGALVTLAGIFMTTRRLLVSSAEKQPIIGKQDSPDTLERKLTTESASAEEEEHLKAEKCGFWFLIIGTIIWAYGDLVLSSILSWR